MLEPSKIVVKSLALINSSNGSLILNFPSWRLFSIAVEGVWRQAFTGHTREYAAKQVGLAYSDEFLRRKREDGQLMLDVLVDEFVQLRSLQGPKGATQQVRLIHISRDHLFTILNSVQIVCESFVCTLHRKGFCRVDALDECQATAPAEASTSL